MDEFNFEAIASLSMNAKRIGVPGCSVIAKPGHMAPLRHVAGISLHAVGEVS